MDTVVAEISKGLKETNSYCVINNFTARCGLGDGEHGVCNDMLKEMKTLLEQEDTAGQEQKEGEQTAANKRGKFSAGELAGDNGFWQTKYDPSKRSDFVYWITEKELGGDKDPEQALENRFPALKKYFDATQAVIKSLVAHQDSEEGVQLGAGAAIPSLSCDRMMLAVYPLTTASRFQAHIDNPNNNGRVLTFTYYLNHEWDGERDGGCLEIYPKGQKGSVVVPPAADTLCAFFSDDRTPHEVRPTVPSAYRNEQFEKTGDPSWNYRFSIATWYSYLSKEEEAAAFKGAFANWIQQIKERKAKAAQQAETTPTTQQKS